MSTTRYGDPNDPDPFKPRNPDIPFFDGRSHFDTHPKPQVSGLEDNAVYPWLVQTGIHTVEVFEAILAASLVQKRALKVRICQAGIRQPFRYPCEPAMPTWVLQSDFHASFDRHVCFVMLTIKEHDALWKWLRDHEYILFPSSDILTPLGRLGYAKLTHTAMLPPEKTLDTALSDLGLSSKASLSPYLPHDLKHIPTSEREWSWRRGLSSLGPDHHGRVADDAGLERVNWIRPIPMKQA